MTDDELDREVLDAWDVEPLRDDLEDRVLASWEAEQGAEARTWRSGVGMFAIGFAAAAALVLAMWPSPSVEHLSASREATQTEGTVTYDVTPGASFVVRTPAAEITVHGTEFTVEILETNDMKRTRYLGATALAMTGAAVAVYVTSGQVEVRNDHGAVDVGPGQTAVASEFLAPSAEPRGAKPAVAAARTPSKRSISPKEREEVQRRLADALSLSRTGTKPHADAAANSFDDEEPATPTLDKEYIREVVREDLLPIAEECYRSALEDEPELSGRLMLNFSITGDESVGGIVDEVSIGDESTMKHPMLGECMAESTASLLFDPPEGGGTVKVTYPFVFTPTDDDAAEPAEPAE